MTRHGPIVMYFSGLNTQMHHSWEHLGILSPWDIVRLDIVPLGFCPPGLLSHLDFVPLGFCPHGILSSWDFVRLDIYCPMGFCPVGFCPRTMRARREHMRARRDHIRQRAIVIAQCLIL